MILLLSGKANCGKDTFAEMLFKACPHPVERLKFADALKDVLAEMFEVSRPELERLKDLGEPYRGYLQRFGSGKMKELFGEDVWTKLTLEKYTDDDVLYIIDDFRFPIECLTGATTVRLHRAVLPDNLMNMQHISEIALDDFEFDIKVANNGSFKELQAKAVNLLDTIGWA